MGENGSTASVGLSRIERTHSEDPSEEIASQVQAGLERGDSVILVLSGAASAPTVARLLEARGIDLSHSARTGRLVPLFWGLRPQHFPGALSAGRDLRSLQGALEFAFGASRGRRRIVGDFAAAAEVSHDPEEVGSFLRAVERRADREGASILLVDPKPDVRADRAVGSVAEELRRLELQADEAIEELDAALSAADGILRRKKRRVIAALAGLSLGAMLRGARAAWSGGTVASRAARVVVPIALAVLLTMSLGAGAPVGDPAAPAAAGGAESTATEPAEGESFGPPMDPEGVPRQ